MLWEMNSSSAAVTFIRNSTRWSTPVFRRSFQVIQESLPLLQRQHCCQPDKRLVTHGLGFEQLHIELIQGFRYGRGIERFGEHGFSQIALGAADVPETGSQRPEVVFEIGLELNSAILRQIAAIPDLEESFRADLEKFTEFVTTWVESPYLPWFGRAVGSSGGSYDFGIPDDSPVYPLTHIYQGHMITWFSNESGGVWGYPDRKREWMDRARSSYEKAHEAFPENRIVRMYLAEAIPAKIEYPAVPNAPSCGKTS